MLFQFGQESSLLLLGFLHGMVFFFLLLKRGVEESSLADKLLAVLLLLLCLHISQYMLGFGGWYDSRDRYSTFMFYFPFHNTLLFGPIIYFYFLAISNQKFKLERKHWLHFNNGFGMNFNDFINSHRVEAVKSKLRAGAHQELTLTSIAYDCGFNSKTTFNRAFKKFTKKSPREFLLQLENQRPPLAND